MGDRKAMVIAFGGMPGHWRKTTAKQRGMLYAVVIALIAAFTVLLFGVWNYLQKEIDPHKPKQPGPDLLDRIHERNVREGRG